MMLSPATFVEATGYLLCQSAAYCQISQVRRKEFWNRFKPEGAHGNHKSGEGSRQWAIHLPPADCSLKARALPTSPNVSSAPREEPAERPLLDLSALVYMPLVRRSQRRAVKV
jgi:hypothetical protein